ncbi:MAG: hypothetical protein VZQ98_15430 [Bacteroidales bacterium]|nr:hypothetical protein [Bacteroidales bacterium]
MERKFIIIDEKSLELSIYVKLSQSQEEILESKELRKNIDQIAKNLHVSWDVRVVYPDGKEANREAYAVISKIIDVVSLDKQAHEVETKAINFMSAIGELTLPAFNEPKCPCHEDAEVIAERLDFCKEVREDMDDVENIHVIGAKLVSGHNDRIYQFIHAGRIGTSLLKELLDLYIEKYDHE